MDCDIGFVNVKAFVLLFSMLLSSVSDVSCNFFDITTQDASFFCKSWRLNAEIGNIVDWIVIPSGCEEHVSNYMLGGQYSSDVDVLAQEAMFYAKNLILNDDGRDAWIFDIDDTVLSHVTYYSRNQFGAIPFNRSAWVEWETLAIAPPIHSMLALYNQLKNAQWSIFFLTGRDEKRRSVTEENLLRAGYAGWTGLILRQDADKELPAKVYKSAKRLELQGQGYRIWGNMGDQYSDLQGHASGERVFKVPNPMYYIA